MFVIVVWDPHGHVLEPLVLLIKFICVKHYNTSVKAERLALTTDKFETNMIVKEQH